MNTSRGGGGKRGADPLFSILNAVFKMSKKCIFPRRRENADPPACQKIAPRGIGGAGAAARPLLNAAAAAKKKGGGEKKKRSAGFSRASRFSRFSGRKGPETEIGGRGERGAGDGGGEKKGGGAEGKNTPREKEKNAPAAKKRGGAGEDPSAYRLTAPSAHRSNGQRPLSDANSLKTT